MQQILMLTMLICAAHYKPNDTVVNVQHKNVQREGNIRQRHHTKTTASSESTTHQRRSVTTTSHHNTVNTM